MVYHGLKENKVALGLVIGLDYADPLFDTLARSGVEETPVRRPVPEGYDHGVRCEDTTRRGYYAVQKLFTDNALIVGDSAGLLAMPALKEFLSGTIRYTARKPRWWRWNRTTSRKDVANLRTVDERGRVHSELCRNRASVKGSSRE